jgi:hypothetical protein
MDLNRVRNVKATFDALDTDDQADTRAYADQAKEFLAEGFPALSATDQAAIAWYLAEILIGISDCHVSRVGKVLEDSAAAYALATVDLLGWDSV